MSASAAALVADIGGTNARFALARRTDAGVLQLGDVRVLTVSEHPSLVDAVRAYVADVGSAAGEGALDHAVFAVASPVHGDAVAFTNSPWTFSIAQLRGAIGLPTLRVVNDFAALSMAIPYLAGDDLQHVGAARIGDRCDGSRSYATIGPGTGLGVGGLLIRDGRPVVVESEGGHVAFAPADEHEIAILRHLWAIFGRVSNERLISGPGLLNLYRAICAVEGEPATLATPEAIVAEAGSTPDGMCARTVLRFCAMLGSVAGDAALALGAWDGVYLGGGIAVRLADWFPRSAFRSRFEDKGRHAALMRTIPTAIVRHPAVGLLGAAAFAL